MLNPPRKYYFLFLLCWLSCEEVDPEDCTGIIHTEYRFLIEVKNNLTGPQVSQGDTLVFEMDYPKEVLEKVSGNTRDISDLDLRHIVVFKHYGITNDYHYYARSAKAWFDFKLPLGEFVEMDEDLYVEYDLLRKESLLIKPTLIDDRYKAKLQVLLPYKGKYFIYWKKGNIDSERIGYNIIGKTGCEWFTTLYANTGTDNIQELFREDQEIIIQDETLGSEWAFVVFEVI